MLNERRYDFSTETNIKQTLWEKMAVLIEKKTPAREAVSLDKLSETLSPRKAEPHKHAPAVKAPAAQARGKQK